MAEGTAVKPAPTGIMVACRVITVGDEHALMPEEMVQFQGHNGAGRRASGAARLAARGLLKSWGYPAFPVLKTIDGVPLWPTGIVGSLTHNASLAIAAVGSKESFLTLGIDVENSLPLPTDIVDVIATRSERELISLHPKCGPLIFAAKEATFKAVYPLDRIFLDYSDIEVDIVRRRVLVCSDRILRLSYYYGYLAVVVLAFVEITAGTTDAGVWR